MASTHPAPSGSKRKPAKGVTGAGEALLAGNVQCAQRIQDQTSGFPPQSHQLAITPHVLERDSFASTALQEVLDRSLRATTARFTGSVSPAALAGAFLDWSVHLSTLPGKQMRLGEKAFRKWLRLAGYAGRCMFRPDDVEPCIEPLSEDRRFRHPAWQKWPFNLMHQSFLLNQQWWHNATTSVRGVTQQHENVVSFTMRQILDIYSPSNFIMTNPEVLRRTWEEGGMNLMRGWQYFADDWERAASGKKPAGVDAFELGKDLAATPGKVVYRNRLIELIQYEPTTDEVRPEPILIVPAWIMKYYILDLSPENSLVRYLTAQGFTVFIISWKNPEPDDRDLGMDDYRTLGVMDAIDVVCKVTECQKVHALGYCLGGTLLSIAAAAMARDGDERLATLSLFAAQTDFTEAGELMLFVNESQVSFLEDLMWEQGFLDTSQMAGAFQLLRSNDLIWSRGVRNYLMGERREMSDLMAWNADTTRMPYRMHSEYLRQLFLDNDLAEGRYQVGGKPVTISDIRAPILAVGTEKDHVAPWRSVYKLHLLTDTQVTFVLTTGGHNAGIVSEPGHPHRRYRISSKDHDAYYVDPETWLDCTETKQGSWWPELANWLKGRSSAPISPPPMGAPQEGLSDAPGSYVFMR
ncbi:PHA/PHB synthase family protein [Hoeflea sp. TYP-13]|uniref:PHA/PHB synthase family protein n=1 Tax=Hoeflea sp. TYP-13 TaxID=3230023 RepID=UPI0034C665A0